MMKMMRETPIAFGLTMVFCLALFFYCWYVRKLRHRLVSVHVSATPDVQEKTGLEKDVVDSFPTIKTCELKVNMKDELQCPICLVEYDEEETLRKLPHCGHVFHIPCVDSWLANQVTCPVCRVVLTGTAKLPEREQQRVQQSAYCRDPSTASSVTIEVAAATPAWILVNRPVPLPPAGYSESHDIELQSSDTTLGFPIEPLRGETAGWGAIYLQESSTTTDFSFRSGAAENAITVMSHSSESSFSFGDGGEKSLDVAEMYRCSTTHGHLPLTVSPEHCVFEFLPIVTSRGGGESFSKSR